MTKAKPSYDLKPPSAARVRRARLAHALTQESAAKIVLVSTDSWRHWENDRRQMPAGLWELFQRKVSEYSKPGKEMTDAELAAWSFGSDHANKKTSTTP